MTRGMGTGTCMTPKETPCRAKSTGMAISQVSSCNMRRTLILLMVALPAVSTLSAQQAKIRADRAAIIRDYNAVISDLEYVYDFTYSVDGKIKSRDRYTDGRLVRQYQYDPEGNLINDVDFTETSAYQIKSMPDIVLADAVMKGGMHDGPITWYHPNGKPSARMNFLADSQNGEYLQYYPDGKPMAKGYYENGNREGLWITWNEDGSIDTLS